MTRTADAVIIGGGIFGASTAHFLGKLGFGDVMLVEKGALCSGSTAYSAAHVRQHYSNETLIKLAVRALGMFENSEEELGGDVAFVRCGYLVIAPEDQVEGLRRVVPLQQELGVDTRLVEPDELREQWPDMSPDGVALAAYEPGAGYADPARTVRALVRSAERWGVEALEGTQVTGIDMDAARVSGVQTTAGPIATPIVINAAGPWAPAVGRMAGREYSFSLSREHEAVFAVPEVPANLPIVSDAVRSTYFRPYGDRQILAGEGYPKPQEPCDPDTYDRGADPEAVGRLAHALGQRVPSLANALRGGSASRAFAKGYSGVYDITADWHPIVGADPEIEGYFVAAGGSGHGFKIAPPIGEALAQAIAGGTPSIDLSSLAPDRFDAGRTFASIWGPGNRG